MTDFLQALYTFTTVRDLPVCSSDPFPDPPLDCRTIGDLNGFNVIND